MAVGTATGAAGLMPVEMPPHPHAARRPAPAVAGSLQGPSRTCGHGAARDDDTQLCRGAGRAVNEDGFCPAQRPPPHSRRGAEGERPLKRIVSGAVVPPDTMNCMASVADQSSQVRRSTGTSSM